MTTQYTTPSGAIVDENGNLLSQPPATPPTQPVPTTPVPATPPVTTPPVPAQTTPPTPTQPAPAPAASSATAGAPQVAPPTQQQQYVVKPGDTLSGIAQKFNVPMASITGYRSGNPNKIGVGETLTVGETPPKSSTLVTPPIAQNPTAQAGTTAPTTATGKTPLQNVIDTWTQVYNQLGLGDIKTKYEKILKEQEDIQKELDNKITDLNNNPWLSADSRTQQIDKLKEKYTPRLNLAVNKAKLYDSIYQQGQQEAQFLVGHVETDTQNAIDLAQKKQDALNKLAEQDIHSETINGRKVLVDYKTRKIVADLGPDKAVGEDVLSVSDATALGVPYGTTKNQALHLNVTPVKPLTEAQAAAATYATRATNANKTITGLESKINQFNSLAYATQSKFEKSTITNSLASDEIRQSRQAERNFLTAVLRKESGASISPTEFSEGEKIYFPRPGDDAVTLANKTQARADAISGISAAAGSGAPKAATPTAFHDTKTNKTYVLAADGKYYPQ